MGEWFQKHWSSTITIGCIVIAAFIQAWQQAVGNMPASRSFPRLQGDWDYVPLILLVIAGVIWIVGKKKSAVPSNSQASALAPGIPTLSALLGQDPSVEFDAKKFFAMAHYSPLTAEVEKNIKFIARQYSPEDKEAFYARFIGLGLIAYNHETSWFLIFGSQLKAMAELNSRGLIPIADLKKHYDRASIDYPNTYLTYTFENWLNFLKDRMLIATYPSQMVELSWNGKDLLKYLAHTGRDINGKTN